MSSNGFLKEDKHFQTKAIHTAHQPEQWASWAIIPPITLSTTYKQDGPNCPVQFEYGRSGNPNRAVLEKCIACLDDAEYGLCFSSGLGAVCVISYLLRSGDNVVCIDDVYGGTNRFFSKVMSRFNVTVSYASLESERNLTDSIQPNTKIIWIESPTNPLMKVIDVEAICKHAHAIKPDILVIVDNTFLTPFFQKPLNLGADIAVYSLTKYVNGHSDVIMGSIATNNKEVYENLNFLQNSCGIVPSPFDCYLVDRSLKTLGLRMKAHMQNGLVVANFLNNHPLVEKVLYPGLVSDAGHLLAKRQWSGCSGVMSFYLKGGLHESRIFLQSLKYFACAESLGGFESLAEIPSIMTHASVPEEMRKRLGITDNLIRLSVGLESPDDLISDLDQAFKHVSSEPSL